MNKTKWLKNNTELIFRIVLFLAFFGHGLVSLGFSSSIKLHYLLADSINSIFLSNIIDISTKTLVYSVGWFDVIISFLILFKIGKSYTLSIAITYLSFVAIAALLLYYNKTGKLFGFAEIMRRLPWISYSLFLVFSYKSPKHNPYYLLRIGLALTFLSHGLASLGIWGLNAGHIELANNILKNQDVSRFIFASGIFDTTIGFLLIARIKSQLIAKIAIFWIIFIVCISFMTGIPDGIFRTGFLLSALYVGLDERCH